MFATYGRMLLDGRRPYVDFWDVHPPLVYLYWALVELVTGPDWLHTCITVGGLVPQPCLWVGVHGLDLLLAVAAALAVAGIARELGAGLGTTTVAALLVVGFANQAMLSQ
jgi:dolichyl-phosphate-mannose--protein O-mannosyl transferase